MKKILKILLVVLLLIPASVSAKTSEFETINNTNTDKSNMINLTEFAKNNGYIIEPIGKSHVSMSRNILYQNEGKLLYIVGVDQKKISVVRCSPEELPGEGIVMAQQNIISAKNLNLEQKDGNILLPAKEFTAVFKKEIDPKTMTIKKELIKYKGTSIDPKYVDNVATEDEVASIIKQYGREGRPSATAREISVITKSINESIKTSVGKDMTDKETLIALKNKLCEINKYDYDSHRRTDSWLNYTEAYSALGVAEKGASVCSGYAEYYMIMCRALGYDAHIVHGQAPGYGRHAWVSVYLNGIKYNFDPTWDDSGSTIFQSDRHSMKTDQEFSTMGYVAQKEF